MSSADFEKGVSLWLDAWRRLRKNRLAVAGGVILLVVSLISVVGPWLIYWEYEYTYNGQDTELGAVPPSWAHLMGTDPLDAIC